MSQETVTIGVTKNGVRIFVEVPAADFAAMYYDTTITLVEIADRLGVGIQGVVSASKRLGLRSRYFHQRFSPAYTKIDRERLRYLIEDCHVSFQKAADEFGVQRHHIARAVTEFGIKTKADKRGIPECMNCDKCKLLKECRILERNCQRLPCEAVFVGESKYKGNGERIAASLL